MVYTHFVPLLESSEASSYTCCPGKRLRRFLCHPEREMALLTEGVSDIIFSRTSDRVLGVFGKHSRKKVLGGHSWSSDTFAAQTRCTDWDPGARRELGPTQLFFELHALMEACSPPPCTHNMCTHMRKEHTFSKTQLFFLQELMKDLAFPLCKKDVAY